MSRLIDAKSAKMVLEWNLAGDNADVASRLIDTVPTIDAVPVVRCKDCKHSSTDHAISSKRTWCDYWGIDPDFDDFCSHCIRKDGDE